jgi:sigma-B regulation protein RsbQ
MALTSADRERIAIRNNVRVIGEGRRPILFAHGFGCDQTMWRYVTPAFEHDYGIYLFDYVGCGKSDWSAYDDERYATLDGYAQDVIDIIEAFDLRDVVFVGHSVSAMVGLLASIRMPGRFSRLVLVGPSPRYINDADYVGGFEQADIEGLLDLMEKNYAGWAAFLAPVVMKNAEREALVQELEQSFCSCDPRMARQFARATFLSDNRGDLPRVTVPALVLQCAEDSIAPDAVGEYTHRRLAGSTLKVMKATGHCPHMSHPQETIAAIRDYLAR